MGKIIRLTESDLVKLVNKVIKDMVFTYEGQLIVGFDWKAKFDYQFQIKGVRQMISVGELYDYLMVDVTIIDGDKITIDAKNGTITLHVSSEINCCPLIGSFPALASIVGRKSICSSKAS